MQCDVSTAFLYSETKGMKYFALPAGHPRNTGDKTLVWGGRCALYGLKCAPKEWHHTLQTQLEKFGFSRCEVDPCLFQRKRDHEEIILVIYVDDMLATASSQDVLNGFLMEMQKQFNIKSTFDVNRFLGVDFEWKQGKYFLSQRSNIEKLEKTFTLSQRRLTTALQTNVEESWETDHVLEDAKLFQSIVGQLNYISINTRMDVSYAVTQLARFNSKPTVEALAGAKSVVSYLVQTKNKKLVFDASMGERFRIQAYCDASLGRTADQKPVIGYVILVNGCVYKYKSKHFQNICDSINEAEFMSIFEVFREIAVLRNLPEFLQIEFEQPVIMNDNEKAVDVANGNANIDRVRHIKRKYLKVREQIKGGDGIVKYVRTSENVADLLTKTVGAKVVAKLLEGIYFNLFIYF